MVAILERVQSGLLGATVSSFGITGLYITFVFGIGRFLRLSTSNMRMRIPFDDLPNTSRLVALCQARPTPYISTGLGVEKNYGRLSRGHALSAVTPLCKSYGAGDLPAQLKA